MTTQSHRLQMLQHLSRRQLMDQLVRSVEQCEHERRAQESVEKVVRRGEHLKVMTQKAENEHGRP